MRRCQVEVAKNVLCNRAAPKHPAVPLCDAHRQMIEIDGFARLKGFAPERCDFYHFAHAGLLRAREAVN